MLRLFRRIDAHVFGSRRCVECGCTEHFACPGGCAWHDLHPDVCTGCEW